MLYNTLSNGRKPPKLPLPWDFTTPPEEDHGDKQHAQKFRKGRVAVRRYARGQTHTQTHRRDHYITSPALRKLRSLKLVLKPRERRPQKLLPLVTTGLLGVNRHFQCNSTRSLISALVQYLFLFKSGTLTVIISSCRG